MIWRSWQTRQKRRKFGRLIANRFVLQIQLTAFEKRLMPLIDFLAGDVSAQAQSSLA